MSTRPRKGGVPEAEPDGLLVGWFCRGLGYTCLPLTTGPPDGLGMEALGPPAWGFPSRGTLQSQCGFSYSEDRKTPYRAAGPPDE